MQAAFPPSFAKVFPLCGIKAGVAQWCEARPTLLLVDASGHAAEVLATNANQHSFSICALAFLGHVFVAKLCHQLEVPTRSTRFSVTLAASVHGSEKMCGVLPMPAMFADMTLFATMYDTFVCPMLSDRLWKITESLR